MAHYVLMWVRLAEWMIADREVTMPSIGSIVSGVGIRLHGEVATAKLDSPDGIVALTGGSPHEVLYGLTGRAGEPRNVEVGTAHCMEHAGAEFVLAVGIDRYQVRFGGWAYEVTAGSRVTVTGRLSIVGDYEWEAFELSESRADWIVNGVMQGDHGDAMLDLAAAHT